MKKLSVFSLLLTLFFSACQSDDDPNNPNDPMLRFVLKFDPTQERLNGVGVPSTIPVGNATQNPNFKKMSVHVIDLTPNRFTPYGEGFVVYKGAETTAGSQKAIDFDEAIVASEGEVFLEIPLKEMPTGTYEYARTSVAYQEYDVQVNFRNVPFFGDLMDRTATLASFVGFNTYISDLNLNDQVLEVNEDKLQGFWAFATYLGDGLEQYNDLYSGQAPAGATTVVNPIAGDSDIPVGSCVVTGQFVEPLVITGAETEDVTITLSYSINGSFEWEDNDGNGTFDFYIDDPTQNDRVVDMGLRGLVPNWE